MNKKVYNKYKHNFQKSKNVFNPVKLETPVIPKTVKKIFRKPRNVAVGSNTTFLKHLIQTDFLFSKSITKDHSSKYIESTIRVAKKKRLHTLNIIEMNSRLKLFIRLLQGLRDNKKFLIHIWCQDGFITKAIKRFLSKYSLTKYMKVTRLFPAIDSSDEKMNFLLILGKPWIQTPTSLVDNWVLLNRTFLVTKMNFEIENVSHGFYKIQNELTDYKKLFFILILISKAILKKKSKVISKKVSKTALNLKKKDVVTLKKSSLKKIKIKKPIQVKEKKQSAVSPVVFKKKSITKKVCTKLKNKTLLLNSKKKSLTKVKKHFIFPSEIKFIKDCKKDFKKMYPEHKK